MPAAPFRVLPDGRVECGLCPHRCALKEGQRGICHVRCARGGRIEFRAFGRISGAAADPVEKKPLYHFLPATRTLSFGTLGCNLGCRFCQNWHISRPEDESALSDEIVDPADMAEAARRAGCPSVSYTYNEPIVSYEYTLACAAACRAAGVRNIAVTAGYIEPGPRAVFFGAMDAANVDLKSFDERFYRRLCGAHLQPVLDTLEFIRRETRCWLEVTTLVIPGENDSDAELRRLSEWIAGHLGPDVPLHFSAFHPNHRMLEHPATDPASLRRARALALAAGLRHVYTGNVRDDEGSTTFCHACHAAMIRRDGFQVAGNRLGPDGACPACGAACAGVWA
jgi:pyruvate formate lyase activating enzyme